MKTYIFIIVIALLTSSHAQFNKEVTTKEGHQFLVGKITWDGLNANPYNAWFEKGFENYVVDETLVNMFKEQLGEHEIKLFLGTWCGDSKREVPRFLKILKAASFPLENIEIVALDRRKAHYKTSPTGEEKGLNIIKVPTFIFFKDGQEINRIVESPIESLEEDLMKIVLGKSYTPNYSNSK